jgi:hypothetical protein
MTMDFFLGQLRLALVAALAYCGGKGWLTPTDSGLAMALITSLGPIIGPWIWSVYVNINGKIVPQHAMVVDPINTIANADKPSATVQTSAGTITGKVLGILVLLAAGALAWPGDAHAQARLVKPTGNLVNDLAAATGSKTTITGAPVTDIQNFLNAKFLPDLQYALKLATASKNSVTADCYQAWIDIITTQQGAVMDTATPPQPAPMPDPHVITEFEKLVELRNALQPESPFMIKCSPVASMVKLDIAQFMGVVISGGAGLATLVPGL